MLQVIKKGQFIKMNKLQQMRAALAAQATKNEKVAEIKKAEKAKISAENKIKREIERKTKLLRLKEILKAKELKLFSVSLTTEKEIKKVLKIELKRGLLKLVSQERKETIKEHKAIVSAENKKIDSEREDLIESTLLRSGSWDAIYNALDGTINGLKKATNDIILNIKKWGNGASKDHLVLDFNAKVSIDLFRLKGKWDDMAMNVLLWLFRQEYYNKSCIYHTDFKFSENGELVFDPNFRELAVYRFGTIISKGIKKIIVKEYVNKYLSAPGNNKNYNAYVDIMDMAHKNTELIEDDVDTIIDAPQLKELENVEFVDQYGDFRYRIFVDKLAKKAGVELTPAEKEFINYLGNGLNSRNLEIYGLTYHKYLVMRNKLIKKGVINNYCNIAKAIEQYKN